MKISFVIPFHNEEKNAGPMIEQVVRYAGRQKKRWDFEIITVNDRSTDATQEVLDVYARKYKFVRPIERKKDSDEIGRWEKRCLTGHVKRWVT